MDKSARNYPLEDIDRETMFHPNTSIVGHLKKGPHIFAKARGVRIKDQQGRDLIDCGAGLWCVNIGYGRKEMGEAAKTAIENLAYYHIFGGASNEPIIRLAERVLGLFHDKAGATHLSKVFFGSGGSDANDTNFKLVRYYNNLRGKPQKKKIISRLGAYHGLTYAAGSLTGIPVYHKAFDMPLPACCTPRARTITASARPGESEADFTKRMIAEIEALIAKEGAETIAAFIAEPIMGTGGVLHAAQGLLREAAEAARQARHPVHRRRGHHRLRPHRPLVFDRRHEAQARHRDAGEGHHLRLLPGVGLASSPRRSGPC